jgi:hypothetical protein
MVSPGAWSGPAARTVSAPASTNGVRAPAAPRPIFRAKGPDDPAPTFPVATATVRLSIPAPEQLGVAPPPIQDAAGLDGTAIRRLERLGAVCFHMNKLETGACRFTCILPTRQPGLTHRIEADAVTADEAVGLVLGQAEQWVSSAR